MEGKEKLSSRLTAAILKDLRLEIKELRKYQADICNRRGGFVEKNK